MKFYILEKRLSMWINNPFYFYFRTKEEATKEFNLRLSLAEGGVEYSLIEYDIPDVDLQWVMLTSFLNKHPHIVNKYERKEISRFETWYVYLVECSDESIYTGISLDVEKRLERHNNGTGARYTAARRPVKLLRKIPCSSHSEALKLEAKIKKLKRKAKLNLVESGDLKDVI